jgi:hypothetical protein
VINLHLSATTLLRVILIALFVIPKHKIPIKKVPDIWYRNLDFETLHLCQNSNVSLESASKDCYWPLGNNQQEVFCMFFFYILLWNSRNCWFTIFTILAKLDKTVPPSFWIILAIFFLNNFFIRVNCPIYRNKLSENNSKVL